MHALPTIELTFDELEAMRLNDLEGQPQDAAAEQMGVSQSTVQRILVSAHRKVAEALVRGKALQIEGGEIILADNLMRQFRCERCQHIWEVPFGTGQRGRDMTCPACKNPSVHRNNAGPWHTVTTVARTDSALDSEPEFASEPNEDSHISSPEENQ